MDDWCIAVVSCAACICVDPSGTVVAKHRKVHLFDIDVPGKITFRESDTLTAGDSTSSYVHFDL